MNFVVHLFFQTNLEWITFFKNTFYIFKYFHFFFSNIILNENKQLIISVFCMIYLKNKSIFKCYKEIRIGIQYLFVDFNFNKTHNSQMYFNFKTVRVLKYIRKRTFSIESLITRNRCSF